MTTPKIDWLNELRLGHAAGRDVDGLVNGLPPKERALLTKTWVFDARADQLPPDGDWLTWLVLGGRGAGNFARVRSSCATRPGRQGGRSRLSARPIPTSAR